MLRLSFVCLSSVLGMVLAVGLASAQPGAPPPSGEPGQGMHRGMGPGMMEHGGGPLGLLRLESVQKDLNLSDAQKEKIKELAKGTMPARASDAESPSPEERRARMEAMRKSLAGILKPEQLDRLKQIQLQVQGPAALAMNPEAAKALGITDDQRAKIKSLREEADGKMRTLFGSARGLPPEQRRAKFVENRDQLRQINKELRTKALEVLTPEQREKLDKLQGKKLDLDLGF